MSKIKKIGPFQGNSQHLHRPCAKLKGNTKKGNFGIGDPKKNFTQLDECSIFFFKNPSTLVRTVLQFFQLEREEQETILCCSICLGWLSSWSFFAATVCDKPRCKPSASVNREGTGGEGERESGAEFNLRIKAQPPIGRNSMKGEPRESFAPRHILRKKKT